MLYCPVCKSEYRDGIKMCSECKVELVSELVSEDENLENESYLNAFADESISEDEANSDDNDDTHDTHDNNCDLDSSCPEATCAEKPAHVYAYQNTESKSEELSSSGIVLTVVGILGLVFVLLVDLKIIPFQFGNVVIMNILMIALFLCFTVFGIYSLKGAKKLKGKAEKENDLTNEITTWVYDNYDADKIDYECHLEENIVDELKYFQRTAYIKEIVNQKFMNLSEDYLDDLIDRMYQKIYGEE